MMTKKIYEETRDKTRLGYVPIITTFISRQLVIEAKHINIWECRNEMHRAKWEECKLECTFVHANCKETWDALKV